MRRYVDLELNAIVSSPGSQNPVSVLEFKRGDSASLEVVFCRGVQIVELDSGATGIFALKESAKYDADFVVLDSSWTKTGTGADTVYTFEPSFSTAELDALLLVNADPDDDLASIDLMGEIQWTISGKVASTQTFIARVANDVIRGDEDTPAALPSPDDDWVAHGHPQTLTDPQKAQARTNIGAAALASPAFTGTPTAPTAAAGTSTTQLATTAFVATAIGSLIDAAPGALDTLNELAAALGDDPNFAATVTASLASKAPLASPTFTGNPTAPTPGTGTRTTTLATTAFVGNEIGAVTSTTGEPGKASLLDASYLVPGRGIVFAAASGGEEDGYIELDANGGAVWFHNQSSDGVVLAYAVGGSRVQLDFTGATNIRNYVFPDRDGTIATLEGSQTFTGQIQLSNQTAEDGQSAMTRDLVAREIMRSVSILREIHPSAYIYSTSGTGSAATAGGFSLASGTTASAWQRAALVREWVQNPGSSGANNPCNVPVAFALAFFAALEAVANTAEFRFVVGDAGSGAPAAIGSNAISARGFGFRIYYSSSNARMEIRTFAHNGTAYSESSPVAFTGSLSQLASALIANDGAGNVKLFLDVSSGSAGRIGAVASASQTGGPTSGNYGAAYASALTLNGSPGPTGQSLVRGISTRLHVGAVY